MGRHQQEPPSPRRPVFLWLDEPEAGKRFVRIAPFPQDVDGGVTMLPEQEHNPYYPRASDAPSVIVATGSPLSAQRKTPVNPGFLH